MKFSSNEIKDLLKAWLVITLIFTIARGFSLENIIISAVGVGIGFIVHELAHKYTAQKYGLQAYFKSFDKGLFVALVLSFFGLILIAPGAVVIPNMRDRIRAGRIAAAGPISNMILSIIFLLVYLVFSSNFWFFGAYINAFLAAFNLIPLFVFDGKKIRNWNKNLHTGLLIGAVILVFIISII